LRRDDRPGAPATRAKTAERSKARAGTSEISLPGRPIQRLKVVAEGVEAAEQLDILRSLGCDQYQGFHYSTPITADAVEDLLRRHHYDGPRFDESETGMTQSKLAVYRAG
jgi:predicted signal transduction protein with EAL and GGDEF domain